MFIKDPSRFVIRDAKSKDCVQLYQLIKQCYLEITERNVLKKVDINQKVQRYQNSNLKELDLNNNDLNNIMLSLDSFDEFVDCLGFGKRGEQLKVLDCCLIEDLNENKIIALVTYSYGYFSYVGKEMHINHLYVRPEYRSNGFAKFLMKNLIKLAAEANLNKIKYDAPRANKNFIRFMKKLGSKDFTDDTGYCLFKFNLKTIETRIKKLNLIILRYLNNSAIFIADCQSNAS